MPRLPAELIDHLACGVAHQIGACDRDGLPRICRGLAAQVEDDGRLSVLLSAQSGFELLAAIRDTARLSVVIARPSTHRTVQIKGNGAGVVVPAEPRYRELLRKRRDAFLREVAGYGFTERFVDAWYAVRPEQLACVTFAPYGAWDQTPGPGAGRPIELLP